LFEIISPKKIETRLSKLSSKIKPKFLDLLITLKSEPVPSSKYNIKKISGSESSYRIRIQSMHLIYEVIWKNKKIILLKIDKRKNRAYKKI